VGVQGVAVGVMLAHELAVGRLDDGELGAWRQAERLVVAAQRVALLGRGRDPAARLDLDAAVLEQVAHALGGAGAAHAGALEGAAQAAALLELGDLVGDPVHALAGDVGDAGEQSLPGHDRILSSALRRRRRRAGTRARWGERAVRARPRTHPGPTAR